MSVDSHINFGNTVAGSAALATGVNTTYFYARWEGYLIPSVTGTYTIGVNSADGANLSIGGRAIVDNLSASQAANSTIGYTQSGTIALTAGVWYDLTLEWQQGSGPNYELQLLWTPPLGSVQVIPSTNLSTDSQTITGNLNGAWWNGTPLMWYPTGAGVTPTGFTGAWSSTVGYIPGDEVTYTGSFWKCLVTNTNSAPTLTNTNWQNVGATVTGVSAYSGGTTYYLDQQVTYSGNVYTARQTTTGNLPTNTTYWLLMGPASLDNLADGTTGRVAQLVYTIPSSSSATWYKLGTWVNRADGGTYGASMSMVFHTGVGFNSNAAQQAVTTLTIRSGNRAAAPNISGASFYTSGGSNPVLAVKVVATGGSTSASNDSWDIYAQMDAFTYGHVTVSVNAPTDTWTWIGASASDPGSASSTVVVATGGQIHNAGGTGIDAVLDGSTYGRPLGSRLSSGKPWIDFSESIHSNKTVDYIADGSTYYRTTSNQVTGAGRAYSALDSNNQVASQLNARPLFTVGTFTTSGGVSQSGTSKTIDIVSKTVQYGSNNVTYSSGSVTPATYGLFYIYADDPTFAGGAVTYQASSSQLAPTASDNRVFFGSITTASGGGGTGGGGGGGGGGSCFSPNTQVKTQRGDVRFDQLQVGDFLLTARGTWRRVTFVMSRPYNGTALDMGGEELVTPEHLFLFHGRYDAGWLRVDELRPEFPLWHYVGEIWNAHLETEDNDDQMSPETEHSYTLSNGHTVHNAIT